MAWLLTGAMLLLIGLMAACQRPGRQALRSISLPMGYVANVQFSPFYVAKERGYFAQAGFDVTFDYRWETDGIQLTASGEVPFTVASGDQIIQARSHELPVTAVAGWYQQFPVALISLENVPLNAPEDLRGLRIGIPETFGASYIGLRALLEVGGLTEADIELQVIGYTQLAALTNRTVDAVVVYANNEPIVLDHQGVAYNMLKVADYVDLVSAVIASSDAFIADDPEAVRGFVSAFLRGLKETLDDPDAAFEISKKYVEGLEENAEVQRAVLTASIALWQTPTPGMMQTESWARAQDIMLRAGLIEHSVPVDRLFTNEFVEVP